MYLIGTETIFPSQYMSRSYRIIDSLMNNPGLRILKMKYGQNRSSYTHVKTRSWLNGRKWILSLK